MNGPAQSRRRFVLRRLHSLTGIVPIGAYLFAHIFLENSFVLGGPASFERLVAAIAAFPAPLLLTIEVLFIWGPLLFHAIYGFVRVADAARRVPRLLPRHVRDGVRHPHGVPRLTMARPRFIVVGGGLAGLMTTIRVAEAGFPVDLFSVVPVKRSHSVCAQGGINAAVNWKGEGDSPWRHFDDTIYGGDFLANQPPVKAMCEAGPGIIFLLDRMGVPFSRTAEGLLDFRRFGGTLHHRTAFAGATTGQQLV